MSPNTGAPSASGRLRHRVGKAGCTMVSGRRDSGWEGMAENARGSQSQQASGPGLDQLRSCAPGLLCRSRGEAGCGCTCGAPCPVTALPAVSGGVCWAEGISLGAEQPRAQKAGLALLGGERSSEPWAL